MVDCQVRPSDVTDLRIIDAMLAVPRERFVPESKRAIAYLDMDIDVAAAGQAKRCLIQPAVLAKMLQAAHISETDRVLVVGCATVTRRRCVASRSRSVRHRAGFGARPSATSTLAALGLANVTVTTAAPADGDRAHGPYDVIVLDGATELDPSTFTIS
jgi:protein-L-isoaspartate(D-aspartate) O-methyltransferase